MVQEYTPHRRRTQAHEPVKQRYTQVQTTVAHTNIQGHVQTMKTYGTTIQKQTYKQAVEMRIRALGALNFSVGRGSNTGSSRREYTLI